MARSCYGASGHVLVTSGDGDVSVIVLGLFSIIRM